MTGYIYGTKIYLGKERQNATQKISTHVTVRSLTRRTEGVGHKLYMDSFFDDDLMGLSDKIIMECQVSLTIRHKLKWGNNIC
jgi:hypothetical protein